MSKINGPRPTPAVPPGIDLAPRTAQAGGAAIRHPKPVPSPHARESVVTKRANARELFFQKLLDAYGPGMAELGPIPLEWLVTRT